ncbi:hypothetical protein GFL96_31110 [Rhizobium leguminosarum bv. viciae]|nr:hypothetical protein [Rhizobium leguminosarum bv. viciae]
MREQPIGEAVEDDDLVPSGAMWSPETEITVFDVHPSLAKAIAGGRGVRFFATNLIGVADGIPLGGVQLAIDKAAGEACGIYLTAHIASVNAHAGEPVVVDEATQPFKFRCDSDLEKAISIFCRILRMAGIIP